VYIRELVNPANVKVKLSLTQYTKNKDYTKNVTKKLTKAKKKG